MKKREEKRNYLARVIIAIIIIAAIAIIVYFKNPMTGKIVSISDQSVSYETMKQVAKDLNKSLSANYWVREGGFFYFDSSYCVQLINKIGNCAGINPDSPYGNLLLPINYNEGYLTESLFFPGSNMSSTFYFRSDEAIVLIGITPPESKFFSYIPYLAARNTGNLNKVAFQINSELMEIVNYTLPYNLTRVMAEIGMPLNDELINTSRKLNGNYNGAFIIVMTADKSINSIIINQLKRDILPKYNLNPSIVNTIQIPYNVLNLGYSNTSDVLIFLNRVAYAYNETTWKNYSKSPPISILRIVPNTPENKTSEKFLYEKLPSKETGVSENYLEGSLKVLFDAVLNSELNKNNNVFANGTSSVIGELMHFEICTAFGIPCGGNDEDCMYTRIPNFYYQNNTEDFLVVVGVNHNATGKAGYNSYALQNIDTGLGFASVKDKDFIGSAREYLPYIENMNIPFITKNILIKNIDKFVVYKFKRDCKNENYCFSIPLDNFLCRNEKTGEAYYCQPPGSMGADLESPIAILERAYDDPLTNLGPSYNEVLPPHYIKFVPKA